ncbi:hypothetical protein DPEC_G00088420 [Dallia pectoralis]|uniref:Uncharacterized protein n=1 Tax=Dallia pectoralis TaxID=75939 RepID=A0ACC2H0J1_DALPE|nr:hypothetical protein DPEC_G00088420 [Dallia pectoralis]
MEPDDETVLDLLPSQRSGWSPASQFSRSHVERLESASQQADSAARNTALPVTSDLSPLALQLLNGLLRTGCVGVGRPRHGLNEAEHVSFGHFRVPQQPTLAGVSGFSIVKGKPRAAVTSLHCLFGEESYKRRKRS